VVYRRFHTKRLLAGLLSRRDCAAAHGLHYQERELNLLGNRWDALYQSRTVVLQPFGVLELSAERDLPDW
jgi:hypothetical protein